MTDIDDKIIERADLIWGRFSPEARYTTLSPFFDADNARTWSEYSWGRLPRRAKDSFKACAKHFIKGIMAGDITVARIERMAAESIDSIEDYDKLAISDGRHRQNLVLGDEVKVLHPNAINGDHDKIWSVVEATSDMRAVRPDNPNGMIVKLLDSSQNDGGSWEPKDVIKLGTKSDVAFDKGGVEHDEGDFGVDAEMELSNALDSIMESNLSPSIKARAISVIKKKIKEVKIELKKQKKEEKLQKKIFMMGKEAGLRRGEEDCDKGNYAVWKKKKPSGPNIVEVGGAELIGEGGFEQGGYYKIPTSSLKGKNIFGKDTVIDADSDIFKGRAMPSPYDDEYDDVEDVEIRIRRNGAAEFKKSGQTKGKMEYVNGYWYGYTEYNCEDMNKKSREFGEDHGLQRAREDCVTGKEIGDDNIKKIAGEEFAELKDDKLIDWEYIAAFLDVYERYTCPRKIDPEEIGMERGLAAAKSDCDDGKKIVERDELIIMVGHSFDTALGEIADLLESDRDIFVEAFFDAYSEFECGKEVCKFGDNAKINSYLSSEAEKHIADAKINKEVPSNFGSGYVARIDLVDIHNNKVTLVGVCAENMICEDNWRFEIPMDDITCPTDEALTESEGYYKDTEADIVEEKFTPQKVVMPEGIVVGECKVCGSTMLKKIHSKLRCIICGTPN